MPYFPKAEAPSVQPYWCHNCAAWFLPQCGPIQTSCCVSHPPGSCCHMGETKLVAEGSQTQTTYVPWVPYVPPTVYPWYQPWYGSVTVSNPTPDAAVTTTWISNAVSMNS